jgi:hypothetical protein
MKTRELTKVQLADLIDAVSYMKPTDWTKYKEDGNSCGDRIDTEDGRRRQADLLNILYPLKSELEEKWSLISELEKENKALKGALQMIKILNNRD